MHYVSWKNTLASELASRFNFVIININFTGIFLFQVIPGGFDEKLLNILPWNF